jgi:predicted solute-binding protein
MLPYFHTGRMPVFATPRLLNDAMRNGSLDAACMSAIAGLRAGFEPIAPALGVGARGAVRSVFLEPLHTFADDVAFWMAWERSLDDGLGEALASPTSLPTRGEVCLFCSGASEHSEWLATTLLAARGWRARVIRQEGFDAWSIERQAAFVMAHGAGNPAAVLVIGDAALVRAQAAPLAYRIDLALAWHRFARTPCVFAAWFRRPDATANGAFDSAVAPLLAQALAAWEHASDPVRAGAIRQFFAPAELAPARVDEHLDYLGGITYAFDASFVATLDAYRALLARQEGLRPIDDVSLNVAASGRSACPLIPTVL